MLYPLSYEGWDNEGQVAAYPVSGARPIVVGRPAGSRAEAEQDSATSGTSDGKSFFRWFVAAVDQNVAMAFGQQPGPPASARQIRDLLALLQDAGHTDFRDARGPMGFSQRQAAGKFTRDEAAELIETLQAQEPEPGFSAPAKPSPRPSVAEQALRRLPSEQLAAELQRRGWIVVEP